MASALASTSLTNATTGVGSVIDFVAAVSKVSMLLTVTGTVTGGRVRMQASHDGINWASVRAAYPATGTNLGCDNLDGAYRYWRALVDSSITGGGSVTATFMEAG